MGKNFEYTTEDYFADVLRGKWEQKALRDGQLVSVTIPYKDARANKNTLYTFKKILNDRLGK